MPASTLADQPPLFPIALLLDGLACLVVGGGRVATRKAASLLECGAEVTVIAPRICAEMEQLPVRLIRRGYRAGDTANYRLTIAATGDAQVDESIFEDGERDGSLVNAADNPRACRFLVPSLFRRGPVTVAVSTGGTSPFLAAWLRRRIAESVGTEFAAVASLLGRARRALREAGRPSEDADWSSLLDEELVAAVAAGRSKEAEARVDNWLAVELTKPRETLSRQQGLGG